MYLNNQNSYLTAQYLRLSQEDGDKEESNSIRNQRDLISDFVAQHSDIKIVDEYVDDGYSGANFERPAFQKMIEDIKKQKINCIIVKDLSRLGRNYIETGKYLEKIFPFLGVRFISITDNYDSANESGDLDQIIVPFKNLINDAYCRDISLKVRSQFEVKRKNGKYIGSFAMYGYCKDPADKNHLIVDEYAAEIVQLIFNMKLDGYSPQHIADKLNEMQVLTPLEYKLMCGMKFNGGFRSKLNPQWTPVTVIRVLTDETYTGMVVQGKSKKINYKVKQSVPVSKENWFRVPDMHEAIVPKSIFYSVQRLMELDTRTAPNQESVHPFSGIVKCCDCGQNMIRRSATKNGKKYYYYHCSTSKNRKGCSSHLINSENLEKAVLNSIRNQIELLVDAKEVVGKVTVSAMNGRGMKIINTQMKSLEAEINRYGALKAKLYQDRVEQIVSEEEYGEISERFTKKINDIRKSYTELEKKKERKLSNGVSPQEWYEKFEQYENVQSLDRKMIITLVEKIVVYSKDKIEVHFNYADEMQEMMEYAAEQRESLEGKERCAV
ncbi:MAG TPA: recombinase family protein [Candidatus Merdenecus merdavium]|nr:recombinase family protein [Candidatus Merdenecus merdavium]